MPQMTKLRIEGFRRLNPLDLEMRPLMVLVGANGVGKTSLLDALGILTLSARGLTDAAISGFGTMSSILSRGRAESLVIETDVCMDDNGKYHYELLMRQTGSGGYAIDSEVLTVSDSAAGHNGTLIDSRAGEIQYFDPHLGKMVRPTWEHDFRETFVGKSNAQLRQIDLFRSYLASPLRYHTLDVSPRAPIKFPQQLRPARLPGANGEDIISFLHFLREEHPVRFETVLDTLHAAFKSFEGLGFPSVGAGMFMLTWKERTLGGPLFLSELSEGTLRFLWLVSLLQSPVLPTITMIDEPEVSLHPELLGLFVDLMREASKRTQLVVATHSDRLVSFLEPKEVVAMDIADDGHTSATWAETMDLDGWLGEYSLDEVWRMGLIGGRS